MALYADRFPSLKTLRKLFPDQVARNLRASYEFHRVENNYPRERALRAFNDILGGYGTEYIPAGHNSKSPAIAYVNMGDTYDTTIMLVDGYTWRVGSWGDIVERGRYD